MRFSFTFSRAGMIAMFCGICVMGVANAFKITYSFLTATTQTDAMSVIHYTEGIGMVICCSVILLSRIHSDGAKESDRIVKECQIPHANNFPASSH